MHRSHEPSVQSLGTLFIDQPLLSEPMSLDAGSLNGLKLNQQLHHDEPRVECFGMLQIL